VGGLFYVMRALRFCFVVGLVSIWVAGWVPVVSGSEAGGTDRYTTRLLMKNGKYSSIFGLVPKEGTLEVSESRVIDRREMSEEEVLVDLVSSSTKRVLVIPGELPMVEADPKPLTGKSVKIFRQEAGWGCEILGIEQPDEVERREAERLKTRFAPGGSPFEGMGSLGEGEVRELRLDGLLTFLGYSELSDVQGKASVTGGGAAAGSELAVAVGAMFRTGQGLAAQTVELEAKGRAVFAEGSAGPRFLSLAGTLFIHGQRELADGRRVPYSIVTDFEYEGRQEAVSPAAVEPAVSPAAVEPAAVGGQ